MTESFLSGDGGTQLTHNGHEDGHDRHAGGALEAWAWRSDLYGDEAFHSGGLVAGDVASIEDFARLREVEAELFGFARE